MEQTVDPCCEKNPAEQLIQLDESEDDIKVEYVPAEQLKHVLLPYNVEYVPWIQLEHKDAPAKE